MNKNTKTMKWVGKKGVVERKMIDFVIDGHKDTIFVDFNAAILAHKNFKVPKSFHLYPEVGLSGGDQGFKVHVKATADSESTTFAKVEKFLKNTQAIADALYAKGIIDGYPSKKMADALVALSSASGKTTRQAKRR